MEHNRNGALSGNSIGIGPGQWPYHPQQVTLPPTLPHGAPWPKISLVTPSYNQGQFIEETILSVLNQGYPNLEYIVMDGGSRDGTVEILKKFNDRITFWVSEKDGGQSNAINRGMARATGDIVTWLNSDDMLAPGALASVAMAFHTSSANVVAGICQLHRDGKVVHKHLTSCSNGPLAISELLDLENCWDKGQFFYQPEVFYKRELWLKAGGKVDESLHFVMDYDLWIRFASAGANLKVIGRPLALYRVHDDQKTFLPASFRSEILAVQKKYLDARGLEKKAVVSPKNLKGQLKIVVFNDIGFHYGAGIAHKRIAEALRLAGHQVVSLAAAKPGSALPKDFLQTEYILDVIHKHGPDVVVFGNLHGANLATDVIERVSKSFPALFVMHDLWLLTGRCAYFGTCDKYLSGCDSTCPTAHEYPRIEPQDIAPAWHSKMNALSGTNRLAVMANSYFVTDKIEELLSRLRVNRQSAPKVVEQIYYGLPTDVFQPIPKKAARQELGFPEDKFIILFSAADLEDRRKGLKHLFRALELLNLPNILIVCAGWRDKKQPLPIFNVLEVGYLTDPQKQALVYSAADLFVGPSFAETFGQVFAEAAACGTPSVGYAATAIPEALRDGITGCLAQELTPEALAEKIAELHANDELRRSLSLWGRIFVENELSTHALAHRLFVALRKMLNNENTFVVPKISFELAPVVVNDPLYLEEALLHKGVNDPLEDSLAKEMSVYVLQKRRLDEYRSGKIPWIFIPDAWAARRRRNRAKMRMDKISGGKKQL